MKQFNLSQELNSVFQDECLMGHDVCDTENKERKNDEKTRLKAIR